jgi:hypothetical protein
LLAKHLSWWPTHVLVNPTRLTMRDRSMLLLFLLVAFLVVSGGCREVGLADDTEAVAEAPAAPNGVSEWVVTEDTQRVAIPAQPPSN